MTPLQGIVLTLDILMMPCFSLPYGIHLGVLHFSVVFLVVQQSVGQAFLIS